MSALGFERRWVIYRGESEGSATPPGWYGWLHHQTDEPPTASTYVPRGWEKPYLPNMTGTPAAYRPPGSLLKDGTRPAHRRRLRRLDAGLASDGPAAAPAAEAGSVDGAGPLARPAMAS